MRMTLLQVFGPTADLEIGDGYMGWDEWDDGLRKLYVASRVEMMDAFPLGSAEESLFVMVMGESTSRRSLDVTVLFIPLTGVVACQFIFETV